jgi:hypothetical protein
VDHPRATKTPGVQEKRRHAVMPPQSKTIGPSSGEQFMSLGGSWNLSPRRQSAMFKQSRNLQRFPLAS